MTDPLDRTNLIARARQGAAVLRDIGGLIPQLRTMADAIEALCQLAEQAVTDWKMQLVGFRVRCERSVIHVDVQLDHGMFRTLEGPLDAQGTWASYVNIKAQATPIEDIERGLQRQPTVEWLKVSESPPRWEHADLGAIEEPPESPSFRVTPRCGHAFSALSVVDAMRILEKQAGRCLKCWTKALKP